MTEWVLIMIMASSNGYAMNTIKVPDKSSCYRVGSRFEQVGGSASFVCTEIKKEM
jgi:hypothetical protein